jgi:hypothetical protein
MRLSPVFCVAALAALPGLRAQTVPPKPAPAKIDQALRARVAQFHQYQLEGNFRKAYDLVSKDSQDFFFSTSKEKPAVFKIDDVQYADKFSKAIVKVSTTNRMLVGFHVIDLPTVVTDHWRLEGGKWMWYHDPQSDQPNFFGLPVGQASQPETGLAQAVPKDTGPQAMASAAQTALQGAVERPPLDKESLQFVLGTSGFEEVLVRNPYKGPVQLSATVPGDSVGITVEPAETTVAALGEVRVKVRYQALYRDPATAVVLFELQPFRKTYSLNVKIGPAPAP